MQAKIKKTVEEKYGGVLPINTPEQIAKRKEQFKNQGFVEQVLEKRKETCLEKYGVDHHMKSEVGKEAVKAAMQEKYGVDYPLQSEIVAEVPKPEVTVPEITAEIPKPEVTDPEITAEVPKPEVTVPEIVAEVPKPEVTVPEIKKVQSDENELPTILTKLKDIENKLGETKETEPTISEPNIPVLENTQPQVTASKGGVSIEEPTLKMSDQGIVNIGKGIDRLNDLYVSGTTFPLTILTVFPSGVFTYFTSPAVAGAFPVVGLVPVPVF